MARTFKTPGHWSLGLDVKKGDIFQIVAGDGTAGHSGVNQPYPIGDYYKANKDFTIIHNDGTYDYPNRSANDCWEFVTTKDGWISVGQVSVETFNNQPVTIFPNGLNLVRIDVYMTPYNGDGIPIQLTKAEMVSNTWLVNYDNGEKLRWEGNDWAPSVGDTGSASGWMYSTGYNAFTDLIDASSTENYNINNADSSGTHGTCSFSYYVWANKLTPDQGKRGINIGIIVRPPHNPDGAIEGYIGGGGTILNHASIKTLPLPGALTWDQLTITSKELIKPNPIEPDDGSGYQNPFITPTTDMLWRQFNFTFKFANNKYRIVDSMYINMPDDGQYYNSITKGYAITKYLLANKAPGGHRLDNPANVTVDMGPIGKKTVYSSFNTDNIAITYILYMNYESATFSLSNDCGVTIYDQYGNSYDIYPNYYAPDVYALIKDENYGNINSRLLVFGQMPNIPDFIPATNLQLYSVDKKVYFYHGYDAHCWGGTPDESRRNLALVTRPYGNGPEFAFAIMVAPGAGQLEASVDVSNTYGEAADGDYIITSNRSEGESNVQNYFYYLPIWDKQQFYILVKSPIGPSALWGLLKVGIADDGSGNHKLWAAHDQIWNDTWEIRD